MNDSTPTRTCPRCEQSKPLTAEHWYPTNRTESPDNSFDCYCVPCRRAYEREWRESKIGTYSEYPDELKRCPKCGDSKPLTYKHWGRSRQGRRGFTPYCKPCMTAYAAAQREAKRRAANPPQPKQPLLLLAEKDCSRCGEVKPLTQEHWSPSKKGRGGFSAWCKECHREYQVEKYWSDPEAARKVLRKSRRANLERTRQWSREYAKRWRRENPEKARAQERNRKLRRRAREYGAEGKFTQEEFEAKLQTYKGRCHWCGERIRGKAHADHLIALARGGSNDIGNIVPSCRACNQSKSARMPWEFLEGRLL